MFWAKNRRFLLLLVYILFFLHTAIWHYWGYQGVGHLGFGELFSTLRTGVITAGTVFTLVVFMHALMFGGLFCGWLCHWGITQDIAAWIMRRAGINPCMRHLDSRLIPWVWFMVLIAQVVIFWAFNGLPQNFSFNASATPVWSGVPRSILLICMTTLISGFVLIFLFGERAFCRSICTFRLWFSWFEKFAPHKVRQIKDCSTCKLECSSSCPMGIEVAQEIRDLGHIKNQECIKCHVCIGACPNQALSTSLRRNSFHKEGQLAPGQATLSSSMGLVQAAMAIIVITIFGFDVGGNMSLSLGFLSGFFLIHIWHSRSISAFELAVTLLVIIGLYFKDDYNDLTSLGKGLGAIAAFLLIARLAGFARGFTFIEQTAPSLKASRLLTVVVVLIALFLGIRETGTSVLIHRANAARSHNDTLTYATIMESCAGSHSDPSGAYYDLGKAQLKINEGAKASASFKRSLELNFSAGVAREMFELLQAFAPPEVADEFVHTMASRYPKINEFVFLAGSLLLEKQDFSGAEAIFRNFINQNPAHHDGYLAMGELCLKQSMIDEAEEFFNRAYALAPASSAYFIADIHRRRGKHDKAEKFFAEAIDRNPPNVVYLMDQAANFATLGKLRDAINTWKKALQIAPELNLARDNIAEAETALAAKKAAILGKSQPENGR